METVNRSLLVAATILILLICTRWAAADSCDTIYTVTLEPPVVSAIARPFDGYSVYVSSVEEDFSGARMFDFRNPPVSAENRITVDVGPLCPTQAWYVSVTAWRLKANRIDRDEELFSNTWKIPEESMK